jgi:hypothetical protein
VQFALARGVREKELDAEILRLGQARPGSYLDTSCDDRWVLHLPRDRSVLLLRGPSREGLDALPRDRSVAWCLEGGEDEPALPTFRFADWRVAGGWTPFAEEIAAYLCESGSAHFAFDSREPAGRLRTAVRGASGDRGHEPRERPENRSGFGSGSR